MNLQITWACILLSPFFIFTNDHPPEYTVYEQNWEELKAFSHRIVDNQEAAGINMLVQHKDKIWSDTYGYQNIELKEPMTLESIFRWASMTKPITATAVMQLVEQGKLSLDDPVATYIPEVAAMPIYSNDGRHRQAENTMLVRHLLSHTSGSASILDASPVGKATQALFETVEIHSLEDLVHAICQTQLAFEPGQGWAYGYSNDLLAYIVEKVSGKLFNQYLIDQIFDPLGMRHTSFQVRDVESLTAVYRVDADQKLESLGNPADSRIVTGPIITRGNGGLTGPITDYLRFCQMLLNEGSLKGRRILKAESVRQMMSNHVPKSVLPIAVGGQPLIGQGYGLGMGVLMSDAPFGQPGDVYWPGALYTYFFVSQSTETIGIFMTQLRDPSKMSMVFTFHEIATKGLKVSH